MGRNLHGHRPQFFPHRQNGKIEEVWPSLEPKATPRQSSSASLKMSGELNLWEKLLLGWVRVNFRFLRLSSKGLFPNRGQLALSAMKKQTTYVFVFCRVPMIRPKSVLHRRCLT